MSNAGTTVADSAGPDRLRALRERAAASIRQREASLAALDACQRRLSAVERQNVELTEVVAELQNQLAQAKQSAQPSPDVERELEALRAQARQAGSWREQADRRITTLSAENQGLAERVKDLGDQVERFRSRNAELLRSDKALRRELDATRQLQASLQNELEACGRAREQHDKEAAEREQATLRKAESLASELIETRKALSHAQQETTTLVQAHEAAEERLRAQKAAMQSLQAELRTARESTEESQQRVAVLEDDLARLATALDASAGRAKALEAERDGARRQVEQLEKTVELQSEQMESLSASCVREQEQSAHAARDEQAMRLRSARVFHVVGEVFGAALKRAVGGLAWISLTDAWDQRLGVLPEPPELVSQDVEALAQKLQHWFVDTGFSREIVVGCERDTVSVRVAGSEAGDDGATVVAQVAVMVPLLLRSRALALRDIGEGEGWRKLVFQPDAKRAGGSARTGGSE